MLKNKPDLFGLIPRGKKFIELFAIGTLEVTEFDDCDGGTAALPGSETGPPEESC